MSKQILKILLRGKKNRENRKEKWLGLWDKMKTPKEPVQCNFSTNLLQSVFADIFSKKREEASPIRIQLGVSAKSEKAANRKARNKLKMFLNVETNNQVK